MKKTNEQLFAEEKALRDMLAEGPMQQYFASAARTG
jgi:hypothetical protein